MFTKVNTTRVHYTPRHKIHVLLRLLGHLQRMEENKILKRVLYMNLESTRPRGRPRNRWQD
jgi:hypothetical protein